MYYLDKKFKLHPDGGSMAFGIVGALLRHYTASQPRRQRLENSSPWKISQ